MADQKRARGRPPGPPEDRKRQYHTRLPIWLCEKLSERENAANDIETALRAHLGWRKPGDNAPERQEYRMYIPDWLIAKLEECRDGSTTIQESLRAHKGWRKP